jgi:hypothetical protein
MAGAAARPVQIGHNIAGDQRGDDQDCDQVTAEEHERLKRKEGGLSALLSDVNNRCYGKWRQVVLAF